MNHAGEITPLVGDGAAAYRHRHGDRGKPSRTFRLACARLPMAKAEIFSGVEAPAARRSSIATLRSSTGSRPRPAAHGCARHLSASARHAAADIRLIGAALEPDCSCVTAAILGDEVTYKLGAAGRAHRDEQPCRPWRGEARRRRPGARRPGARRARPPRDAACGIGSPRRTAISCLIDESYNANPASMRAALARPGRQRARPRRSPDRGSGRHAGARRAGRRASCRPCRGGRRRARRCPLCLRPADAPFVGGRSRAAPGQLCATSDGIRAPLHRRPAGRATSSWSRGRSEAAWACWWMRSAGVPGRGGKARGES